MEAREKPGPAVEGKEGKVQVAPGLTMIGLYRRGGPERIPQIDDLCIAQMDDVFAEAL
jgi:hypothetical protein